MPDFFSDYSIRVWDWHHNAQFFLNNNLMLRCGLGVIFYAMWEVCAQQWRLHDHGCPYTDRNQETVCVRPYCPAWMPLLPSCPSKYFQVVTSYPSLPSNIQSEKSTSTCDLCEGCLDMKMCIYPQTRAYMLWLAYKNSWVDFFKRAGGSWWIGILFRLFLHDAQWFKGTLTWTLTMIKWSQNTNMQWHQVCYLNCRLVNQGRSCLN